MDTGIVTIITDKFFHEQYYYRSHSGEHQRTLKYIWIDQDDSCIENPGILNGFDGNNWECKYNFKNGSLKIILGHAYGDHDWKYSDNTDNNYLTFDSKTYGNVSLEYLIGKILRYWNYYFNFISIFS